MFEKINKRLGINNKKEVPKENFELKPPPSAKIKKKKSVGFVEEVSSPVELPKEREIIFHKREKIRSTLNQGVRDLYWRLVCGIERKQQIKKLKEREFSNKVNRIYEMVQEETVEIYEKALEKINARTGAKVAVSFEVQKRAKEIWAEM
jgi:hypothetical protein